MQNQLRLKDGLIMMDGFENLKGKIAYFALYPNGVTIHETIKNEKDFYYKVQVEDEIKDDILYELLKRRGIIEDDFVYINHVKAYYEMTPTRNID